MKRMEENARRKTIRRFLGLAACLMGAVLLFGAAAFRLFAANSETGRKAGILHIEVADEESVRQFVAEQGEGIVLPQ